MEGKTPTETNAQMKNIAKIIKRHSFGCYDVEDVAGNRFRIQLAFKIEELFRAGKITFSN